MATKTYSQTQIFKVLNWIEYSKIKDFLKSNGISPLAEFEHGGKTYRTYSQEAMDKAQSLRNARMQIRKLAKDAAKKASGHVDATDFHRLEGKLDQILAELTRLNSVFDNMVTVHADDMK